MELGIPIRATFEYQEQSLDVVVVPEWTPDGAFTINYSNAIEYEPETRVNQIGVSYKAFNLGEAFGTHPLLSQAWRDQATAQLLLQLSTLPFQTREDRRLAVRVSSAEPNHRGKLVLDRNQAGTVAAGISEAKFSLVGFQDFIAPGRQQASLKNLTEEDMVTLNALAEKLEDDAKISVSGTARKLVLDSGEGWSATLTKDTGPTRDSVSHTGIISRPDGGSFNPGEIEEILRAITYFLAFVAGKYTHPSAVIEFDSSHKSVWGRIGRVGIDSKRTYNWFVNNVEAPDGWILENLFPKFWEKWKANTNELVAIIDCYVASNAMVQAGIPNDAVAKSYSGLETLAGLCLGQTIQRDSHREINRLLSSSEIPHVSIDSNVTPAMNRLCVELLSPGNKLGPYLLGSVRRYVTHPLDTGMSPEIRAKHLAHLDSDWGQYVFLHDLCQFYLESMLLHYCEHPIKNPRLLLETLQR